jgi:hypothetical protein
LQSIFGDLNYLSNGLGDSIVGVKVRDSFPSELIKSINSILHFFNNH